MNRKERRIAERAGQSGLPGSSATPIAVSLLSHAEGHYRSGQLHEADALCIRLLAAEPRVAPALLMRGLIAHQLGRPDEALVHLTQAVALAPAVASVHHALAEAYRDLARAADAERHYRRVAKLQPNAVTLLNLGNILMTLQRPRDAANEYQSALRFDARLPETHYGLGRALAAQGRKEATDAFGNAIALRPDFALAHEGLIEACLAAGDWDAAWRAACAALLRSDTPKLRALFVNAISYTLPTSDATGLRETMQRALVERWTRPQDLVRAACAVVALRQPFDVRDTLLRIVLDLAPICHRGIEQVLTEQRRTLLEIATSGAALSADELEAACVLARQCFINEYAWDSAAEWGRVDTLCGIIQAELDAGRFPSDAMVVACAMYFPLASLDGVERLLAHAHPPPVAALLTQQLTEPAEERRLGSTILCATGIEDTVSRAVREQYEANPYPRWVAMPAAMDRVHVDAWLAARFPDAPIASLPTSDALEVLVAGCGTGQHPLETIRRFVNVRVLAIDLSLASLAYAARMTAALGVEGIEYIQADLLQAAQLDRSFDVIESAGVLHHLGDIWTGWRALLRLLRPGGVMNVSLYTVRGRRDVRRARDWIAAHGYRATPEDIRRCRQDLMALPDDWARRVCSSQDFGSASTCRDLLFHVQEKAVSPPELSEFFRAEGIKLVGIEVPTTIERQFRAWCGKADGDVLRDLTRWDAFEEQHPTCFAGMINMWVQKPESV